MSKPTTAAELKNPVDFFKDSPEQQKINKQTNILYFFYILYVYILYVKWIQMYDIATRWHPCTVDNKNVMPIDKNVNCHYFICK